MRALFLLGLSALATPGLAQDDPAVIFARNAMHVGSYDEGLPVLLAAAENGDMRAVALVGTAYELGWGVEPDMSEAMRWYERAADLGYPAGDVFPGLDPAPRRRRPRRPRARPQGARRARAYDYPPALAEYGSMLAHGEGGPVETELGVTYLEMSAALGDFGRPDLARMLHVSGEHVDQDEEEARRLFAAAAAQGNWGGQAQLGRMAAMGQGGPVDLDLAVENYRAAMGRGFDLAGGWMAEAITLHPELDPRPLAAAAHCLWAEEVATKHAWPDFGWRVGCWPLTGPLTDEERAEALALARTLPSAP
jgi:TPR repeat protein